MTSEKVTEIARTWELELIPIDWAYLHLHCACCEKDLGVPFGAISRENEYSYSCFKIPRNEFDWDLYVNPGEDEYIKCPGCNRRMDIFKTEHYFFIPKYYIKLPALDYPPLD